MRNKINLLLLLSFIFIVTIGCSNSMDATTTNEVNRNNSNVTVEKTSTTTDVSKEEEKEKDTAKNEKIKEALTKLNIASTFLLDTYKLMNEYEALRTSLYQQEEMFVNVVYGSENKRKEMHELAKKYNETYTRDTLVEIYGFMLKSGNEERPHKHYEKTNAIAGFFEKWNDGVSVDEMKQYVEFHSSVLLDLTAYQSIELTMSFLENWTKAISTQLD